MRSSALHTTILPQFDIARLDLGYLLKYSPAAHSTLTKHSHQTEITEAGINQAVLTIKTAQEAECVTIRTANHELHLSCSCNANNGLLCAFQFQSVLQLMENPLLRVFFDPVQRSRQLREISESYGLEDPLHPENSFRIACRDGVLQVEPLLEGLIPLDRRDLERISKQFALVSPIVPAEETITDRILVWSQSRFQDRFCIGLYETPLTRNGKPKGPFRQLNPVEALLETDDPAYMKFYGTLAGFQQAHRPENPASDLEALRWILNNPGKLAAFTHELSVSESLTAAALKPALFTTKKARISLTIHRQDHYFHICGELTVDEKIFELNDTGIRHDYFLQAGGQFHLVPYPGFSGLLQYLKQHRNKIILHENKFGLFRKHVLEKIEENVRILYTYLKPATPSQRLNAGYDAPPQPLLYLDEAGQYIHVTPVMRYGYSEVPVLSQRIIYDTDPDGVPFSVPRDDTAETQFLAAIIQAHPLFAGQAGRDHFSLHKSRFMDEDWFLQTFDDWRRQGISILGFNQLRNNRFNAHLPRISVNVISGIDWFETRVDVRFGAEKVPLRQLFTSIRNKTRYIPLGDGTTGILPAAWIEKFRRYLSIGTLSGEVIRTSRYHFQAVEEFYDHTYLAPSVADDIRQLTDRLSDNKGIPPVALPAALHDSLRPYQHEGVKWLHFMDEAGFGAFLADDMGLGKTLQVIAFLRILQTRRPEATHLIVVPASLLFNWQQELEKWSPSLTVLTLHGQGRQTSPSGFKDYQVVLTTYSLMAADAHRLKSFLFDYIILDESQNIKNPDSQRYRAACSLKSRNRIILSGTPVENNTMDLYSQFSFVCPGLLGSWQYFKDHYFVPVDKFKESARAAELQRRIFPFMLRRTKEQVASQLPEKTEIILYCEMETAQRRVYDAYAREFRNYLQGKNDGDLSRERMHILQGLTKLRQICNSPALLNDEEYYGEASAKLAVLMEQVESLVPRHKILIFSQFVSMLDLIGKELDSRHILYTRLTGSTRNRKAVVESFQNDPSLSVFLVSLKAGGTGLNLTAADYVFLADPWWNPATENQAIDRTHRIGQQKPVVAARLICPETIEEKILKLQRAKKELTGELIRAEDDFSKKITREMLLELVAVP